MKHIKTMPLLVLFFCLLCETAIGSTLSDVRQKGYVQVGLIGNNKAGFHTVDRKGRFNGFDVELWHVIAAAALGDAKKVKFTPLTAKTRFTALQSGEIDVLLGNRVGTLSDKLRISLTTIQPYFYDGQGFMAWKKKGIKSIYDLGCGTCAPNKPVMLSVRFQQ